MRIAATQDATRIVINGHGIRVDARHEISSGVFVTPPWMGVRAEQLEARTQTHLEYAAILSMGGQATFAIEVNEEAGGEALVRKGWNALWLFGLLSMASRSPCLSLFAFCDGKDSPYSLVARNFIVIPNGTMQILSATQAGWMRQYEASYDSLVKNERFSAALRAYSNAQYLFDLDLRLMLTWAGIEGLLAVDGELRRRNALYAAMLHDGSRQEKVAQFHRVKKAYDFRSKIVHGSSFDNARLASEYKTASDLLVGLLAKCVVLGRVPSATEFDEEAASLSL